MSTVGSDHSLEIEDLRIVRLEVEVEVGVGSPDVDHICLARPHYCFRCGRSIAIC